MTLEQLNKQFGVPGKISFEAGEGGLTRAVLNSNRSQATVYLHGAHVASFHPKKADGSLDADLLWVSGKSFFETGKPIRGGVPICFPWFGNRMMSPLSNGKTDQPMHGFVRLVAWEVESVDAHGDGRVTLQLIYRSGAHSAQWLDSDFEVRHQVTVGEQLEMTLLVRNTGKRDFLFEEALHTYFSTGDIRKTRVLGLEGKPYLFAPAGTAPQTSAGPVVFSSYTDNLYPATDGVCVIDDAATPRKIRIDRVNSRSTVVWNPWIERAKEIADFGDDEWPGMLCVETANARGEAVTLGPGAQHLMRATITRE